MRNFTKIVLVVLVSMVSLQSYAQTFGVKAGLSLSNMKIKDNDNTYSNDYKANTGFHIGATVDIPVYKFISFETGILLTTKGYYYEVKSDFSSSKFTNNLYYLDIPLTAKFSAKLSEKINLYGAFGPYIGFGLSGKNTITTEIFGIASPEEEADINWGSDDNDHYKRLDLGLTLGGGVEFKKFQLGFSYDLGLGNISSFTENGTSINNKVFKLSFGYRF